MSRAEALVGREFDGYRIVRLLGQGGMGAVYEGLEPALGRRVAIKVLAESVNRDPDAVKRFQREARAVASVSHPNIAQIYRVGTFEDFHYYAMEYVDGKSLDAMLLESRHLSGRRCYDFLIQAAKGLKAAADQGITHRDIKPANLMVTQDGTLKIVDFGIAKMMADGETFHTATGTIMGTPAYMSPEQCKGQGVDFRSDMYSLGCTFFHVLTGHAPFEGDTAYTVMARQISAPVPAIPALAPNTPERFCNVIYTLMEKNSDNRYQTYEHLLTVLEAAREGRAAGFTAQVVGESPAAEGQSGGFNRRTLIYALGGLLAVAVIGWAIHLLGGSSAPPAKSASKRMDEERPAGGLEAVGKGLREINKVDRDLRKEAREGY